MNICSVSINIAAWWKERLFTVENNAQQIYLEDRNVLYMSIMFCDLSCSNHHVVGMRRALVF